LLTLGDARLEVTGRSLSFRSAGRPAFKIDGYPSKYDCDTPSSCRGLGQISLFDDRVVVVNNDFNTDVTAYAVASGTPTILCPGLVMSLVMTETGRVACGQYHGGGPSQPSDIVSEGAVIASGPGVDPRSLTRRGDQLVWMDAGAEHTAPIPR
jgi:hypothetical protein